MVIVSRRGVLALSSLSKKEIRNYGMFNLDQALTNWSYADIWNQ